MHPVVKSPWGLEPEEEGPIDLPIEEGDLVLSAMMVEANSRHVPHWLPEGFGLAGTWRSTQGQVCWRILAISSGISFLAGMAASTVGTVLAVGQDTNQSGVILSN